MLPRFGKLLPFFLSLSAILIFLLLITFATQPSTSSRTPFPTSTPLPSPTVTSLSPALEITDVLSEESTSLVPVMRVVDGDTIVVLLDGNNTTIRLIGVNTPETVDPRRGVECFGKEASQKTKELLTGRLVRLEPDPTQAERDRYNRLLRYVYLEDGTLFNQWIIEEGFAYEYTYDKPYQYQEEFRTAQEAAESGQKGLWYPGICSPR
jgi:micrococcal nuclease